MSEAQSGVVTTPLKKGLGMGSSSRLYTQLFAQLRAVHPTQRITHIANWTWIIVGLIQAKSVQLSQIAQHIPGEAQAAGRIAKIRRWLMNARVDVNAFYQPLIAQVLTNWRGKHVYIILDGCTVNRGALQILRISLSHCARALPLAWHVVAGMGLVQLEVCVAMLNHVACLLQPVASVTLLADRGFRDRDWAQHCCTLGWSYIIRIANNTTVTLPDGRRTRVSALGVKPGQRRYFTQVRLSRDADWVCNVAITWTTATPTQPAELCVVATKHTAGQRTLDRYLKRMHSEASFRDDTSGGFTGDGTKLRDPDRLSHLLLALAVAVLWVYEIGEQVLHADARAQIDPAHKRQLSVFQLGWRALRRAMSCHALPPFTLHLKPRKLDPSTRKC